MAPRKVEEKGWQDVAPIKAEPWQIGDDAGTTLTGVLKGRHTARMETGEVDVYEVQSETGLVAVFARGELASMLSQIHDFPGVGTAVRIRFVRWEANKKGGRRRVFSVAYRSDRSDVP